MYAKNLNPNQSSGNGKLTKKTWKRKQPKNNKVPAVCILSCVTQSRFFYNNELFEVGISRPKEKACCSEERLGANDLSYGFFCRSGYAENN